ncbi:segregation/condensation protein A [Thalassotalea sp. 1_MG-2023]|uniref:segregation and condensation protein A n=1 Tax=Thalassotalea sp. 1_MG-2023 TaxID=3062680 RepID=UPI0026E3B322|nr:segregation/condensation protein A [Thalassotalea sp. 1_MG-2023]MDO6427298.1 segregation/condensation protein A [Thalassotalea sp. 1_MG-2023]
MQQQVLPFALIRGEAIIEKPQDLFIPPNALEVILESFEGPLDLLLYLIKKQKLDILDLPIAPITTQYMRYVALMEELNMELAAEYLVMASILAEIKSKLLLPKQPIEDEEHDPRAELIKRLKEYEVIKHAAESIDQLPRLDRDYFCAKASLSSDIDIETALPQIAWEELVQALQGVLARSQAFEHHQITKEVLSTRERMTMILSALEKNNTSGFTPFEQLFQFDEGRQGVLVTFLAILELLKMQRIECQQSQQFGVIYIRLQEVKDE